MKEHITRFLDHAETALEDAEYLYEDGRVLALANRAYYAIFYCVSALLASEGVYTKKHSAARAKFSELFVKTNRFDMHASKIVGNSFAARQAADYDMEAYLDELDAKLLLDDARHFFTLTTAYFLQHPTM
ncbi:HEPN domain-containing protein [Spirosoma pomorum]|jgi:uncharacterized protein (UPF0332 family)